MPLEDGALDVAIFSLSLMSKNFTDYLREARRCLRLGARLHIWEPTSYFDDVAAFCAGLAKLGFDVMGPEQDSVFTRIDALRNAKKPDLTVEFPFRGHAKAIGASGA